VLPRKVWYVLPVIPYQPQESPQPGQILGGGPVLYSSYLLRVGCHPMTADNVSQVLNLPLQESALGGFELEVGTSESLENLPQTVDVSQKVWGDHDDVIEVYQSVFQWSPHRTCSMSLWNVAGAEVNPKGSTFHFHNPSQVMNAAFSWASGLRGTCQ